MSAKNIQLLVFAIGLTLLAGCGVVERRITPNDEGLPSLSKAEAVAVLRDIAPYANQEIYEIDETQFHAGPRWIAFTRVRAIVQRGVSGSSSNVDVRLLDDHGIVLARFDFWGTYVYYWPFRLASDHPETNPVYRYARNDRANVSRFVSALLSLCPNVR